VKAKSQKEKQDAKSPPLPLPFWTESIDLFSDGRVRAMLESAKTNQQHRLAKYLNLMSVLYFPNEDLTFKAGQAVVQDCPDCLRAYDALSSTHQVGLMRLLTTRSFSEFSHCLRARLATIAGLPDDLAKRIRDTKPADEDSEEVEFRVGLLEKLKQAGKAGSDALEPSLDALARMIEEIEFKQLIRRLELEYIVLSVPTDSTIATYRPLCERHRFGIYVDTFSNVKTDVEKASSAMVQQIDPDDEGYMENAMLHRIRPYNDQRATELLGLNFAHADPVFRDELMGIDAGAAGTIDNKALNPFYMNMMWRTSSHLPLAVAARISRDWEHARDTARQYEKDYADEPIVLAALISRYTELKQYDDAERCAKQVIKLAPNYGAYSMLARIYKRKKDMAAWKRTLEQSLSLPSLGLEKANVRNRIAHYHMSRKEWKEAVAYADEAAASYAEWALLTAARCHEMLGEWKQSEALVRASSERYEQSAATWFIWCCRTGHGDAQAAAELARKHFESFKDTPSVGQLEQIGVYYLLTKEPDKALVVFQKAFDVAPQFYVGIHSGMHAALIADQLGQTALRDRLLSVIAKLEAGKHPFYEVYAKVAAILQKSLAAGKLNDADLKQIDEAIVKKAEWPAIVQYFVAAFLQNRGQAEKAHDYLRRAAQSKDYEQYNVALACHALRELKLPVPASDPEAQGDD
jgi:tetratricopeptide (TPR) repeat protein